MRSLRICVVLMFLYFLMLSTAVSSDDNCRSFEFIRSKLFHGQRLMNHVIKVKDVKDKGICEIQCFMEANCVSYNLENPQSGDDGRRRKCELNNFTYEGNEEDLVEDEGFIYRGVENNCVTNPCKNNATCQSGYTDKGYRCLCTAGFKGQICDEDIDECTTEKHVCSVDAVCKNIKGSFTCSCNPGYSGGGEDCKDIDECAAGKHECSPDAVCNNIRGSHNCTCRPGYSGDGNTCQDIDECASEKHDCSANAICSNTMGSYRCRCKPGYSGGGWTCTEMVSSCKEAHDKKLLSESGVVALHVGSITTSVFCHVGDFGCGNGAWTPVMKIDGNKQTFHYSSDFWSNMKEYNLSGGETGFDTAETKLPSYWNTPFSKICLSMKIDQQIRFIVIDKEADSLYSLIADGRYRATSLGRNTWKSLIGPSASLQLNCNKEGFNAKAEFATFQFRYSEARIGIIANNYFNCRNANSRIGFGTGGFGDDSNTCGNEATILMDHRGKHIKAMGYILVL